MREHDGIIKIESPLVKSMDEREIPRVALNPALLVTSLKPALSDIFVDKIRFTPYNLRQFNKSGEL
jgi:hypothetical protein